MSYASILYTSASGTTFALTNSEGNAIEYLRQNDISVFVNDVLQTVVTDYTFNAAGTAIVLNTAVSGAEVYITRTTDIDDPVVDFTPGSTLTSTDLNNSNDQYRFALQEFRDTYAALTEGTEDLGEFPGIIDSTEAWISDDSHWPTTATLDNRFVDQLNNETIAGIKTFSSSPVVPTPTTGTQATNKAYVDDNYWNVDGETINLAEQDAGSPAWDDNHVATTAASAKRFDTLVQTATPTGSTWEVGKTWLQNDANNTLSIWDGTVWRGVASGGTFTTQNTVIYVDSINGDDTNDGHRIINPMQTIRAAVASADAGDIILVAPGVYQETLPIDITVANLSIVGSSQRSCFIHPTVATEENTMFRCNSGTYIDGFTFCGLKASGTRGNHAVDNDPVQGLPENQAWVAEFFPNATIRKSPYINNCTSFADTGIDNANFDPNNYSGTGGDITSGMTGGGIFVDGSAPATASPLRSFVVNEFTQVNLDGPGLLVANNGYCQAVSFFGTFCHYHAKALNGGQINMEVGTTDFGRFGLIADGHSAAAIFTATTNGSATTGDTSFLINAPTAGAGWFGTAERPSNNMLLEVGGTTYPILSSTASGGGWSVTISNPEPTNRAINNGLVAGHAGGVTVSFFLRSQISAAAHTFEYAGSGVNYTALPQNGGVPVEANEVIQTGAAAIVGGQTEGRVWYTSTNEVGKFKAGDTFQVDQQTGFVTIDPTSVAINVVSDLTPQLGGDLDVQTRSITTSVTNGDVTITPNGTGNVVLDGLRYPEADGTTGQFLQTDGAGNLTFQDAITEVLEDTTPQLGGDLDVQTNAINTSTTDGDIDLDANGAGLIQVTEFNLSQVPIVTQHDIGTAANEVPLNGMLGGMAFQDPASVSVDNLQVTNQITGNLAFASGNGIDFSADGNAAGMTSELLDDYEEGTWTPRLNGWNGSTYVNVTNTTSYTAGRYVKVGGFVTVYIDYAWSSMPIASNHPWYIYDLPFTPETNHSSAGSIGAVVGVTNAYSMDILKSANYTTQFFIYSRSSNSAYGNITNTGGAGGFVASITYFTNS